MRAITYDELVEAYDEQMQALIEGGVDALLEDTMLFVAMGISFWWICLTRLVLAMVTVWTMRLKYILLGPR